MADAEGTGTVEVQVARDHGFRKVVARDFIKTNASTGHSAKARITGLQARTSSTTTASPPATR